MKLNDYTNHNADRRSRITARWSSAHLLMLALAGITLLAAACTTDDDGSIPGDDPQPTPVRLIAGIQHTATPATRLAPGGTDGTQAVWTKDDRIGLFMLPAGGKIPADTLPGAHNVPYEVDPATGELTQLGPLVYDPATDSWSFGAPTPMYYPSTDEAVDFVAYWPYVITLAKEDPLGLIPPYLFAVSLVDQTTAENQLRADVLYSDNARNIHRSKDAVALQFRHLNAKLRLDITLGEGFERGEVTEVTLPGMPLAVDFDMRNGSVNKIDPWDPDIGMISCLPLPSPAAGTGATASFTAIVPPHEGAKFNGRKITVTVDGEDYTGTIPDAHDYIGNTMYAYPVRVTPRGITIGAPTDDVPWTDGDVVAQFPDYDLTIANEEQLRAFAKLVNTGGTINGKPAAEAKVLQTADIRLTKEWVPIGYNANPFLGAYNGDGHTITGLTITTAPAEVNGGIHAGLFGYAKGAVLTGIHLREVQINFQAGSSENDLYIGSIAGKLSNSTLSLCSATGKVDVDSGLEDISAGGIAGYNGSSTISRCRAGVEIKVATTNTSVWTDVCVGEIAGYNYMHSFILSCEAQGRPVTAKGGKNAYAGGIIGHNRGFIAFCRTGANTVTAQNATDNNRAGGLVGNNLGYLYSCYSRTTATATGGTDTRAGAIVGRNSEGVQHCYGTGSTDQGTSNLAATDKIVYNTSPGNSAIYKVVTGYTGMIEKYGDVFPTTTHYNSSSIPAHGIEKVEVKWGAGAWQHDLGTMYPEINMEYEGIPYNAP